MKITGFIKVVTGCLLISLMVVLASGCRSKNTTNKVVSKPITIVGKDPLTSDFIKAGGFITKEKRP